MKTARRNIVHCASCMHADVLITRADFVIEIVWYIFYKFYAPISVCITLCFVLCPSWIVHCFGSRILNRTNSCYELQMIDIVPWYSTLLQYCNTGSRSSSLHRYLSFDDRKFLDMTINLFHIHNSKVSTRHMILH